MITQKLLLCALLSTPALCAMENDQSQQAAPTVKVAAEIVEAAKEFVELLAHPAYPLCNIQ